MTIPAAFTRQAIWVIKTLAHALTVTYCPLGQMFWASVANYHAERYDARC